MQALPRVLARRAARSAAAAPSPRRRKPSGKRIEDIIPADENKPFDMMAVIDEIIDEGSWLEIKALFARGDPHRLRAHRRARRGHRRQPAEVARAACSSSTSADKAARFIWLCDAFNVPLLYLADVPGLHDRHEGRAAGHHPRGREDDRRGERGHRAEDLASIVRKAYGAGLYAMCGPAFEPDACIALPTASIAVMGPQAAVNAVYYNKIQEIPAGPSATRYVAQAARRVPGGHRHPEARERAGHRRRRPGRPAARARSRALRALRRRAPAPPEEAHRPPRLSPPLHMDRTREERGNRKNKDQKGRRA